MPVCANKAVFVVNAIPPDFVAVPTHEHADGVCWQSRNSESLHEGAGSLREIAERNHNRAQAQNNCNVFSDASAIHVTAPVWVRQGRWDSPFIRVVGGTAIKQQESSVTRPRHLNSDFARQSHAPAPPAEYAWTIGELLENAATLKALPASTKLPLESTWIGGCFRGQPAFRTPANLPVLQALETGGPARRRAPAPWALKRELTCRTLAHEACRSGTVRAPVASA